MRPKKRITRRRKRSQKQNGQRQINKGVQTRATTIPKWSGKIRKRKATTTTATKIAMKTIVDKERSVYKKTYRVRNGKRTEWDITNNSEEEEEKNSEKPEYIPKRTERCYNEKKCLCSYMNWALKWPLYFIKRYFSMPWPIRILTLFDFDFDSASKQIFKQPKSTHKTHAKHAIIFSFCCFGFWTFLFKNSTHNVHRLSIYVCSKFFWYIIYKI